MDDIKSLYDKIKSHGWSKDIEAYTERVNVIKNQPNEYMLQLEYIFKSNIGLSTFKEFVEKHGISVASYNRIMKYLESNVDECRRQGRDDTSWKETISMMESFHARYEKNFIMFETFMEKLDGEYLYTYYSRTTPLMEQIQTLFNRYGLAIVPDVIVEASKLNKLDDLARLFEKSKLDATTFQWLHEVFQEASIDQEILNRIHSKSLEGIFEGVQSRSKSLIRESVLSGNTNMVMEYSEEEIRAMEDLISFKEYMVVCLEDPSEIMRINNQVFSIYEEFDGLVDDIEEDVATAVLPMMPNKSESMSLANTKNKQTGDIPDYLRRNHNLNWGEDNAKSDSKPTSDEEPAMDDFKRPSSEPKLDDDKLDDLEDKIDSAKTPQEKQQAVNNYYYYTYTNSFNKHKKDDHSSHHASNINKKIVDSSTKSTDDHSVGKRINSDDVGSRNRENNSRNRENIRSESSAPWELNVFRNEVFTEGDPSSIDDKPESDHPIRDTMMDVDQKFTKYQQGAKKAVQDISNVGKAFVKPFKRTSEWISSMVAQWKDKNENQIKEKMADPHARKGLFNAIKKSIIAGSLMKAGILFNPYFIALALTKKIGDKRKSFRLRNEMIGELKAEVEIIDTKIQDADRAGDNKAKYQLMRLKNEIKKKLIRVGGTPDMAKII